MCTMTWLLTEEGYEVFFNRDEQLGRVKATPPVVDEGAGVNVLMPIDPEGGGSWIAVNEFGLTVCLLNYYQGQSQSLPEISRGQLVKHLSVAHSIGQAIGLLKKERLESYAPFTLLMFSPKLTENRGQLQAFQWDGIALTQRACNEPMISSSIRYQQVMAARRATYHHMVGTEANRERLLAYHRSHRPELGYQSVCMHREDAKSVSFTHVVVENQQVSMDYVDGSPCDQSPAYTTSMPRLVPALDVACCDKP